MALYRMNEWDQGPTELDVLREKYLEDDVSAFGSYKLRAYINENGERADRGIDFKVEIRDNAVLKVEVDCRTCG